MPLYLGQWQWQADDGMPSWVAPFADLGLVDLRSLPQCGTPGPTPEGYGFFDCSNPIAGYKLGDALEGVATVEDKRDAARALGLGESVVADTPLEILVEVLTRHADPTGNIRWKPLRGSPRTGFQLYLGSKLVWQQAFKSENMLVPGTMEHPTLQVFQEDYKRLRTECLKSKAILDAAGVSWEWVQKEIAEIRALLKVGLEPPSAKVKAVAKYASLVPPTHYKKVLQAASDKYGVPPEALLVGSGLPFEGVEKPSTVIGDTFVDTDNTDLSLHTATGPNGGFSWTEVDEDIDIVSNQARSTILDGHIVGRANSDLASDDHYAQALVDASEEANLVWADVMVRSVSTMERIYYYFSAVFNLNVLRFWKCNAFTHTQIGSDIPYTLTAGTPVTLKGSVNNSTLEIFINGVSQGTVTDTSITGYLRTGIRGYKSITGYVVWANFEAGDLAAAAAGYYYRLYGSGRHRP